MPYQIVPYYSGYRVKEKGEKRYFSNHPLSYEMALRQMRALYLHLDHHIQGGIIEDDKSIIEDKKEEKEKKKDTGLITLNDLKKYMEYQTHKII